jgi:OPT oligopeptide transporter protein
MDLWPFSFIKPYHNTSVSNISQEFSRATHLQTTLVPILGGVSIFCLAMPNNLFVTNLFGGSMANEGLGILALSFDWQFIGRIPSLVYVVPLTVCRRRP